MLVMGRISRTTVSFDAKVTKDLSDSKYEQQQQQQQEHMWCGMFVVTINISSKLNEVHPIQMLTTDRMPATSALTTTTKRTRTNYKNN